MAWTPSAAEQFARLFRLPPEKALAYLAGRGKIVPTYNWQDLWHDEHARAFTISRLTRLDMLKSLQEGITAAVNGNLSRRDWIKATREYMQSEGWWGKRQMVDPATGKTVSTTFNNSRLKLIFDTNARQAYAAGRWEGIEEAKATHPYVRYITKGDDRVREAHAQWDGVTLPVDDPFWDTHAPPCDYRCRCRITTLTKEAYDKRKADGSIKTSAPPDKEVDYVNRRTGQVSRVPEGVNPAFAYNPGKAAMRNAGEAQMVGTKLASAPAALGAAAAQELPLGAGFGEFFDQSLAARAKPQGKMMVVGAMRPAWVAAATRAGIPPASAEIAVRDRDIAHEYRDIKKAALPAAWFRNLPAHLKTPKAVLLDTTHPKEPAFLLVYGDSGDQRKKLVVRINYHVKKQGTMNIVGTGKTVSEADLKAMIGKGCELVEGGL